MIKPGYGSHLPILIKAAILTSGKVLECGTGLFSTPVLHWLCEYMKRPLRSLETVPEYYAHNLAFKTKNHSIEMVKLWGLVNFDDSYGLAFIDCKPGYARKDIARILKDQADMIVLHDTQDNEKTRKLYGYQDIYPLFKYSYHCRRTNTSVLSNKVDLYQFNQEFPF